MRSVYYVVFVCCILVLGVSCIEAVASDRALEPLTGSRITFPAAFASGAEESEQPGQFGTVHSWVQNGAENDAVQFDMSVKEVGAKSIADVLNTILFEPDVTEKYVVRELSKNHIVLDETHTFIAETTYLRHWAWLLDDGSYFYAVFQTKDVNKRALADEFTIAFAAQKGTADLSLMTVFPRQTDDPQSVTGTWRNPENGMLLDVYGDVLMNFYQQDGAPRAYGYYSSTWKQCDLWNTEAKRCSVQTGTSPESIAIGGADGINGNYVRVADEAATAPAPSFLQTADKDSLRGTWENNTQFCTLLITRSSVNVTTKNGLRVYEGYTVTPEGLRVASDIQIRKTGDGGLLMDGYDGVFYRTGEGKGVSKYADFKPYNGSWENTKAVISLSIKNGGMAFSRDKTAGISTCSVDEEGYLHALKSRGHIDSESGNLIFDDIEGEFVRKSSPPKADTETTASQSRYILRAKDADLRRAPSLILEGSSSEQNLGGWQQKVENVVSFDINIEKAGDYRVGLFCSREPKENAVVSVSVGDGQNQTVTIPLSTTGNWANYRTFQSKSFLSLPAGQGTLYIQTGDATRGDHLMNLRSVTLIRKE